MSSLSQCRKSVLKARVSNYFHAMDSYDTGTFMVPRGTNPHWLFPSTTIMMLQLKCLQKILDNLTWHVFHSWSPEDDPDCLWDLLPFTCRYLRSWVECSENFWMNCHEIVVQRFMFSWGYTGRASVTPLKSTICSISALKCNLLSCLPTSNPEKSIILFKVTGSFTWSPPMIPHCFKTLSKSSQKLKLFPDCISGGEVEHVNSFRFLGINITGQQHQLVFKRFHPAGEKRRKGSTFQES